MQRYSHLSGGTKSNPNGDATHKSEEESHTAGHWKETGRIILKGATIKKKIIIKWILAPCGS
jgi:hypothetical protein